jgi:putative ABC transport system permease protein
VGTPWAGGAWRALLGIALRHARRRPLQSGLLVLGVALGVAVVVAIDLANGSALAAFRLSTEVVAGRATHRIVGGPGGLDERLYARLRTELGLRASAPVVEGLVTVPALGGASLTLLGVDPLAEPPFRDFLAGGERLPAEVLAAFLTTPGGVLLSEELAARAGVAPGDRLSLDTGGQTVTATLVGRLRPRDGLSARALDGLIIADVSSAQELLARPGRLDRIDLRLPPDEGARAATLARVGRILPAAAAVVPAGEQQATVEGMTRAFQLNLTALSLLALLVGMFLIFNTVRFSIVQRRPTLATLRALGVTRREIFALLLAEALVLGLLGSALGMGLGVLLGRAAVGLVTQTITDLYFAVSVRDVAVPAATLLRGGLAGVLAALAAAVVPAFEATGVPPVTALRRSDLEARARAGAPRALGAAVVCLLAGVGLLAWPGRRIDLGFAALAAVVFAFALSAPAVTLAVMAGVRPATERLFGPVGRMAPRNVARALSRTAVAIAALMIAVSVSIGVGLMVDSFRRTVERWLADTLRADVFISPAAVASTRLAGALDPALVPELEALPEVARVSTARAVTLRSPRQGPVQLVAVRDDIAGDGRRFLAADGPADAVWRAVQGGAVTVSEPFARRHGLWPGDRLRLQTDRGEQAFPIAAVFYDYGSDQGVVFMADPVYRAHWADDRITSIALFLRPDSDADAFARALAPRLAGRERLQIQATRGLRAEVLQVFDRAFAITVALQLLAILVAFIGVLSALMALQLERARELATLRAVGLTERQLGGLSVLETGLVGLVAGLLAWPAGLTLALILTFIINRRSFGWTIQFTLDPALFARALLLALAAALLAGVYPTWRLRRLAIARALREE